MARPDDPVGPLADQTLAENGPAWPEGVVRVDLSAYMVRPNQLWSITPEPQAGGYFGAPYYSIRIAGTERALAVRADGREVEAAPRFTGDERQLWRIDQLTDGTYRIAPKDGSGDTVLAAIGTSSVSLVPFAPDSDAGRWRFHAP